MENKFTLNISALKAELAGRCCWCNGREEVFKLPRGQDFILCPRCGRDVRGLIVRTDAEFPNGAPPRSEEGEW